MGLKMAHYYSYTEILGIDLVSESSFNEEGVISALGSYGFLYEVTIKGIWSDSLLGDKLLWAEENLKNDFTMLGFRPYVGRYIFSSKDDAMRFKLTF
jgi:hypothetical protein